MAQQKQEAPQNSITGPMMRPLPSNKPPTQEQTKAQQTVEIRLSALKQQLLAERNNRQNWITDARSMRQIQNSLVNDPLLREAVFTLVKGGAFAFVALEPKVQLEIIKTVNQTMSTMARTLLKSISSFDPNDPINLYNQANPNNLVNQQQAIQQGIITEQDNLETQSVLQQDDNVANQEQSENSQNDKHLYDLTLTEAELLEIQSHNQANYSNHNACPTPSPGSQKQTANEENSSDLPKKVFEHLGEETALKAFMNKDPKGVIEGCKGLIQTIEHRVVSTALHTLATAAAGRVPSNLVTLLKTHSFK